ncbi:Ribosomal RNA adenine dimethylase [candidate division SR1 bacterium RAAC1_SR1_1]|nr:Ribosomal RNA adenine dimethylase [candidate division SR1 bacterium RAAC1_SR1_1]
MKDYLIFFSKRIKNGKKNASMIPSSKFLSRQMIKGINFDEINSIIELGPGTGVFTQYVVENMKKGTKLICIEIEDDYIKILKKKFGNQIVILKEDVRNIDNIRKKYGIEKIDLIISGLPFKPASSIHNELKKYTSNGTIFRSFTYQPYIFKKQYHDLPIKKIGFAFLNIPPAWVYGIN